LFSGAGALLRLAEFLQGQVKDQILPFSGTSSSNTTSVLVETLEESQPKAVQRFALQNSES